MPLYESVVIARQDLATAQVDTLSDELTNILQEGGGKVTKRESWGLRQIAYRIKKNRKGHYVLFNIDAPPAAVNEYERRMRINEDVLRDLTERVEALEEGPSSMLQNKGRPEDEPRGGRGGFGRFGGGGGRGGRGRDEGGGGGGFRARGREDGDRPPRDGGGRFGGDGGGGGGGGGGRFDSGRRPRESGGEGTGE
jgi:small subunit ribosomal protein S6